MPLTSQIKELGAILQKLINLDWSWSTKTMKNIYLSLMAMRMNLGLLTSVVGSVQQRKRKEIVLSQELEKWENKAVLSLCLVKRKLLKNMIIRIK
jgi:hypothetical protein